MDYGEIAAFVTCLWNRTEECHRHVLWQLRCVIYCTLRKLSRVCHQSRQTLTERLSQAMLYLCCETLYNNMLIVMIVKYIACFFFSWFMQITKIFLQWKFPDLRYFTLLLRLFGDSCNEFIVEKHRLQKCSLVYLLECVCTWWGGLISTVVMCTLDNYT